VTWETIAPKDIRLGDALRITGHGLALLDWGGVIPEHTEDVPEVRRIDAMPNEHFGVTDYLVVWDIDVVHGFTGMAHFECDQHGDYEVTFAGNCVRTASFTLERRV
jgi:hypothetical protein